ncbi:MAG: hypothetical protein ACI9H6_000288 [Patiriisocius sp.]|jgi:hypothetical protein
MAKHKFSIERMFELDVHHMLLVKPGVTSVLIYLYSFETQCKTPKHTVWEFYIVFVTVRT